MLQKEIEELEASGTILLSGNDGEVILKKVLQRRTRKTAAISIAGLKYLMETTPGAYSGCLMTLTELYLYRDPYGFRPLYYGRWRDAWVFGSETCAFHERDATIEREVYPGEVIVFDIHGKQGTSPGRPAEAAPSEVHLRADLLRPARQPGLREPERSGELPFSAGQAPRARAPGRRTPS